MSDPVRCFQDLECWQSCRQLRLFIAKQVVPLLPNEERFRLRDQLLRAARSTTANIAEGYGRHHYLDNSKFCRNARGSCYEVIDHLITASDECLIPDALRSEGDDLAQAAIRRLNGYIKYLQRAAIATTEPR